MAKFTKKAIMFSLLQLLKEKSIDKITVKDICEECEINRNTFYYYFSDINMVLEEMIKDEKEKLLIEESKDETFYEEFLHNYNFVLNNKKAFWHIYDSRNRDILLDYLYSATDLFVTKHVSKVAKEYNLSDEDIKFIVDFYSNSIIGVTIKWLKEGMPDQQEDIIRKISSAYQASIHALAKSCVENKKSDGSVFK